MDYNVIIVSLSDISPIITVELLHRNYTVGRISGRPVYDAVPNGIGGIISLTVTPNVDVSMDEIRATLHSIMKSESVSYFALLITPSGQPFSTRVGWFPDKPAPIDQGPYRSPAPFAPITYKKD